MDKIKVNLEITIYLNFETQISKLGRPFRLSGTRMNLQIPPKWIDKIEKHHWIHTFRYLDEKDGFFEIYVDYYGTFLNLEKF
jgi:hypothetical protein